MPLFDYAGQLASGALFQGTLEAASQAEAEAQLAAMGVRVTTLRPVRRAAYVAPLSLADFTFFNEQLAALTRTGLPLEQGLRQLAADVGSRKLKRLLGELADDLAAGTPLPQALERQQHRFPPQYAEVVEAGLKTGDLSGTLYGLTTHLRLKSGFRRAIVEVFAYPLAVLLLAFGVASLLMRVVVPRLAELFSEIARSIGDWGVRTDASDAFIFHLARAWPAVELVGAALLAAILLVLIVTLAPGARRLREGLLRSLPGVSRIYWSSILARFTHTSALAAFGGAPLPELLVSSGAASGSPALADASRRAAERVGQGQSLDQVAATEPDLPALWTCAVQAAGPRGDLPGALAELARTYELRAQQAVNAMRTVLGPLLFVFLVISIGGLVVSLLTVVNSFLRILMSLSA